MYSSWVGVDHFVSSRTPKRNEFVTPFVNNERTYLALISLLTETPNKFSAMTAHSRLFEESGYEFVALYFKNILLFQSSFSFSRYFTELTVV
jgi:hypothetical protein